MNIYKVLSIQQFRSGNFEIVPIRKEDRHDIRNWRNEQIYHLRQEKPLSQADQDLYFDSVIGSLFERDRPDQIIFSYLESGICIGYGGLVHINWIDRNAEISFIMKTDLEKSFFEFHWKTYLGLIEQVAFQQLRFHKIYTYGFDLRPNLFRVLECSGYAQECRLKEHCFSQGKFKDVLIHSKFNPEITFRLANEEDGKLTFKWVNNENIRRYSLNQKPVSWERHSEWFKKKIKDGKNCIYLLAFKEDEAIGSVRYDVNEEDIALVNYLVDPTHHGKGLGNELIKLSMHWLIDKSPNIKKIKALVLNQNIASCKIFNKNGFDTIEKDTEKTIFEKKIR